MAIQRPASMIVWPFLPSVPAASHSLCQAVVQFASVVLAGFRGFYSEQVTIMGLRLEVGRELLYVCSARVKKGLLLKEKLGYNQEV